MKFDVVNRIIKPFIAVAVIIGTFYLFKEITFGRIDPQHKDILLYVLGCLSAFDTMVLGYYFGNSHKTDKPDGKK